MSDPEVLRRIVLIAECAAEGVLLREIERLGFSAYSSVNCVGRGARATVDDVFAKSSHVRIEALGSELTIQQLKWIIQDELDGRFSVTYFTDLVEVGGGVLEAL